MVVVVEVVDGGLGCDCGVLYRNHKQQLLIVTARVWFMVVGLVTDSGCRIGWVRLKF